MYKTNLGVPSITIHAHLSLSLPLAHIRSQQIDNLSGNKTHLKTCQHKA